MKFPPVKEEAEKTRVKKLVGISEICQCTVAPLVLRNNDYSDDDKRLVIRYSAICRERPSERYPYWYIPKCVHVHTCHATLRPITKRNNIIGQQKRPRPETPRLDTNVQIRQVIELHVEGKALDARRAGWEARLLAAWNSPFPINVKLFFIIKVREEERAGEESHYSSTNRFMIYRKYSRSCYFFLIIVEWTNCRMYRRWSVTWEIKFFDTQTRWPDSYVL